MPANLTGWHGLIVLLVVVLLFAAPKLPQLARNLGQSITIFRSEVAAGADADKAAEPSSEDATRR